MRNLRENYSNLTADGSQREESQQMQQNPNEYRAGAKDQIDDSIPAWKTHFSLGANVRFTRTPEAELLRRRGLDVPALEQASRCKENSENEEITQDSMAEADLAEAAASQPMAVAALQGAVSNMVSAETHMAPFSSIQNAEMVTASAPLEEIQIMSPAIEQDEEMSIELEKNTSVASAVPAASDSPVSLLSDFAFFEGFDLSALTTAAPILAEAVEPAETIEEGPSSADILASFRVVEWRKSEPQTVSYEAVTYPAKQSDIAEETLGDAEAAAEQVETALAAPAMAETEAEIIDSVAVDADISSEIQTVEDEAEALETPVSLAAAEVVEDIEATITDESGVEETLQEQVLEVTATAEVEDDVSSHHDDAEESAAAQTPSRVIPRFAQYQPADLPPVSTDYVSGDYIFPPNALLQLPPVQDESTIITQEMLERSAGLLESVLEDFGVRGEIIHVRPGPVVTLYEFEPAPGVKSSRVIGLSDDIARSMSALSARVAVVPGRNVIGIELPNANRETVYLREMIDSRAFEASNYRLPLCLGKGIGGEPIIAELAKMPHLLVAGTTGSGKSVAINTMILSLLYRFKPEECRLIMVDPKMLELSIYDGIPHLLTPVVTDPKKAVVALKWAVREMEERYRKMARLGVRNIEGFNQRAASAKGNGESVMCTVQSGFDKETGEPVYIQEELDLTPMPYIVVIIDEMADLMMVAGKDIEGAVQRLAQMARAAGIHLIMATQRPSVDVITGTIKANFPTRISFQVTSKIDSRTILGEMGAEQLLGQGDMLHMAGGGRIVRVHGPFVSDEEVEDVVSHLKGQGRPDYLATVTEGEEEEEVADDAAVFDQTANGADEGDELYSQAVKVVMRDKKCSTSYIQRRLGIGYNRAASLVERMEKEGLVGAANHVGKREILMGNRDS